MTHELVQASHVEAGHSVYRTLGDRAGFTRSVSTSPSFPAGHEGPERDHRGDRQGGVYAVVSGAATLRVVGEELALTRGSYVFCSPASRRQITAGDSGLTYVGIGAPRPEG